MNALSRKLSVVLPALALLFGITACDSNDESSSDAEKFVGSWAVTSVSDANGPADLTTNFNSIIATFNSSGGGTIVVDAKDDAGDRTVSLAYSVDESAKTLALNLTIEGVGTIPLTMSYSISSDEDTVTFTISQSNAAFVNSLFGTSLTGAVTMTVSRM